MSDVKSMDILTLTHIQRWYGDGPGRVHVLHGIDLTLKAGEAVAIVGPSGSGKSTLLHVAGLLDKPDGGEVRVEGKKVDGAADSTLSALRNRNFGFVYQHHHLLREFTARENVEMPAIIGAGKAKAAISDRATALLKAVGLDKRLEHYPGQMSGGEQQRVAIARALMNGPKAVLADEPTGNLDPHTAEGVSDMLFKLVKTEGLALLLVTHNMELAKRCHRVLKMADGRLG
jgi:lipoprotein-releasing system ATP-binding protein